MTYIGIDDGAGDYGTAICDQWHCESCDVYTDGDCIGDLGYMPDEWDALEDEDEI